MIPRTLNEWNLDVIEELLTKGYWESELFDFKEMLPHPKNDEDKQRLIKTCCAFANGEGGFLVFGISDDRSKLPIDRIVGIEPKTDFPEHFGAFPQKCVPSVYWNLLNPAISLSNGKVIHVVEIPKSWNAPHSLGSNEVGWYFAKRTNKGNEGMSYEEIRLYFLGYYEKRLKLQLLHTELQNIIAIAQSYTEAGPLPLFTFELNVINIILADSYIVLAEKPNLLTLITKIRNICNALNQETQIFWIDMTNIRGAMRGQDKEVNLANKHNNRMIEGGKELTSLCLEALSMLKTILPSQTA